MKATLQVQSSRSQVQSSVLIHCQLVAQPDNLVFLFGASISTIFCLSEAVFMVQSSRLHGV